jgi:hypothetical protein
MHIPSYNILLELVAINVDCNPPIEEPRINAGRF